MNVYQIYCAGEFIETQEVLNVYYNYNKSLIAKTYLADSEIIQRAIIKANEAKEKIRKLHSYQKYEILMYIATKLKEKKEHLAKILALEACKPWKYAEAEIERAVQTFTIAAEESKRLPAEYEYCDLTPAGINKEALIKYFPVGVIAGIVPFNFPMNLAAHKIAPAIASGNCIIIKPSTHTPLSTLELAKIIDETPLPKGAFSVLPTNRENGTILVTHDLIDKISFTGSSPVGWNFKKICGKKKITLELGGNAGVIITPTADLNVAIPKCVTGAFAYQGQICIHTQRIYVHETIFDEFLNRFLEKTRLLKIGDVLDPQTDISAMIDEENAIRVENWINEAIAQGAKLLIGGKRTDSIVEPTVLTNTNKFMKVNSQEVFGPVVVIEKYKTFEEAISLVNDTIYGLQAGVFTNLISEMNDAFEYIKTGAVLINEVPTFRLDHLPYGGIKDSGFGREGIKYAIKEMTEPKLLIKPC
ncbi:MAG: aldehyde dehydrogenase family protein [Bacteroidales bacterium]|nr:aldehyde dehydrogenase family protein [Bacteroidales bacterium]